MKKALYMFFLLFVLTFQIQAQKVGLVLSGGGAKWPDPHRYHQGIRGKSHSYRLYSRNIYGSYCGFAICHGVFAR